MLNKILSKQNFYERLCIISFQVGLHIYTKDDIAPVERNYENYTRRMNYAFTLNACWQEKITCLIVMLEIKQNLEQKRFYHQGLLFQQFSPEHSMTPNI